MNPENNIFLFPAFVLRYSGKESEVIHSAGIDLSEKLKHISNTCSTDLSNFDFEHNNFLNDELKNQLITYTISCIYADILAFQHIRPAYAAGLSMGLYAALYCGKSIGFEDGVRLIKSVFEKLQTLTDGKNYTMLNIVGLSAQDLIQLISEHSLHCEIVIKNGNHSFIISGETDDIARLQSCALEEGALYTNLFPVSIPYHSSFLYKFREEFAGITGNIEIRDTDCNLLSAVTGKFISDAAQIKLEIIQNLIQPIDWKSSMLHMNKIPGNRFFECGPGNSMTKISKFLDADIHINCVG